MPESAIPTLVPLPKPVIMGVGEVNPEDIVLYIEGSVVSNLSPTIMGTSLPGSRVQVFDNGILLGEVTADDNWHWQYTIPRLAPIADHVFTAKATFTDGTVSVDAPYSFTLHFAAPVDVPPDVLPVPVITGVIDHVSSDGFVVDNGFTTDRSPTLIGTSVPGTQVQVFDNGTLIGQVTTADDWSWSYTLPGDNSLGEHVFSVVASTADGSASAAAPYTQTVYIAVPVDLPVLLAPVITGVIDDVGASIGPVADGGSTDDRTPTLQGTSVPGTHVRIFDNGAPIGEVTTADDWSWNFTLPTQEPTGDHIFSVVASTGDGYRSAAAWYSQSLHIDAPADVAPALPVPVITAVLDDLEPLVGAVADGGIVSDQTPTVTGTSFPGTVVTVFDNGVNVGEAVTGDDWTWSLTLPRIPLVPFEPHTVTVSASQADGTGTVEGVYPFHFDYATILYADGGATVDQLLATAGLPAAVAAPVTSADPATVTVQSEPVAALDIGAGAVAHPELLY